MSEPFSKEEWIEAGIDADKSLGHPARRTPEEGVKEMQERIAHLTNEQQAILASDHPEEISRINAELKTAQVQLAAYELQLKGKN